MKILLAIITRNYNSFRVS